MAEHKRYFTIECDEYHDGTHRRSLEQSKRMVWMIRDRSTRDAGCPNDHWINEWAYRADGNGIERYMLVQKHIIDQVEPERGAS